MRVEQLDDLPLLGEQLKSYGLSDLLDTHFPDHGLWQGISGGKLAVGWLLYILSQGDHRLSHVEDWATLRLRTLGSILEEGEMRSIDFCDDRLARLLDRYSNDETWHSFEEALGSRLLQVYRLAAPDSSSSAGFQIVRADSFNAPQFRSEGALFTYGYSKQRRSDQPFCKVMVAAMDPLCLPLAIEVLKGSGPDVDHYLPIIQRVQSILGQCGNLYVGDSQLGSFPNRLQIHHDGDYYLCPLGRKQCSIDKLHHYLDQVPEQVDELPGLFTQADAKRKSAYFYEITENLEDEDSQLKWTERRLLVYCPEYAEGLIKSFNNRLNEAETAIGNLVISKSGRRNPKTLKDLYARVDGLIKKYKVEDCFEINCHQTIERRSVQRYKSRAEEMREYVRLHLEINRRATLIEQKRKRLGWQIYATNAPEKIIDTADLVRCYRDEYRIEHLFDYLINRDVGLLPIFLKKEKRIKGLIRLLSLAMRCSVLIQYQVRGQLAKKKDKIQGIYPGNKTRATANPTTPMLLRVFRGIALVWLEKPKDQIVQMTPLNSTQLTILELLGVPRIYHRTIEVLKTYPTLRET